QAYANPVFDVLRYLLELRLVVIMISEGERVEDILLVVRHVATILTGSERAKLHGAASDANCRGHQALPRPIPPTECPTGDHPQQGWSANQLANTQMLRLRGF